MLVITENMFRMAQRELESLKNPLVRSNAQLQQSVAKEVKHYMRLGVASDEYLGKKFGINSTMLTQLRKEMLDE